MSHRYGSFFKAETWFMNVYMNLFVYKFEDVVHIISEVTFM